MAKYEDYAKKYGQDKLQDEIEDAGQAAQDRKDNPDNAIPERFRDKTPEEIAASYVELENKFSQQGNDLGTLRRTVDEMITLQSQNVSPQDETPTSEPVSVDEIYENPDAAIRRAVQEELGGETGNRIEQLEQALAAERTNAKLARLDSKHDGWRTTAESPEFAEWVGKSAYRQRMVDHARSTGDIDAAEDLLDMYSDVAGATADQADAERNVQLSNAGLESGSPAPSQHDGETFSRLDLLNARIAAKQGNMEADTWLRQNAESIAIAYETPGGIVD
jgi:hypothetical protein